MPQVQVRDLKVAYRELGRADGPPLVLLHAFTHTGRQFDPVLDELGSQYHLYVPDLRGHGRTVTPKDHISHLDLARDAAAFARAAGLEQAHFCGLSTGAMLLTFLVLENPELVKSLVYGAATYTFEDHVGPQVSRIVAEASEEMIDTLSQAHGAAHGAAHGRTIMERWRDAVLRPNELPFTPEELGRITCPTLVIHGDRDPFFPLHIPLAMYRAIPKAELCILPRCGHNIPRESPALYAAAVLQFLGRQETGG